MCVDGVGVFCLACCILEVDAPRCSSRRSFNAVTQMYIHPSPSVSARNNIGSLSPFFSCACNSRSRLAVNHPVPPPTLHMNGLPDELLLKLCDSLNDRAFKEHCVLAASVNFRAIVDLVRFSSTSHGIRTVAQPVLTAAQPFLRSLLYDLIWMFHLGPLSDRLLLARPAPDNRGFKTGHDSAQFGGLRLRALLLAVPGAANMVVQETTGCTVLMLACEMGHIEAARWLLIRGADANRVIRNGKTVKQLVHAFKPHPAREANRILMEELLEGAQTRAGLLGGAMVVAIQEGDMNTLEELLAEPGSDANWSSTGGGSLLQTACIPPVCPDAACAVRTLLDAGADPNYADPRGDTALHDAAANGLVDCMKHLLISGADAALKNENGRMARDVALDAQPQQVQAAMLLSVEVCAIWDRALRMLECHRQGVPSLLGLCVVGVAQCTATALQLSREEQRIPAGLRQYVHKLREWANERCYSPQSR